MRITKIWLSLLLVIVGCIIVWYKNYPAYEKLAEERVDTYLEAQGYVDRKVFQKESLKNFQGRWEIVYKFEDEKHLNYQYTYDKSGDRVLLFVYESPKIIGGRVVRSEGWTYFDKQGNMINE
jgi:hypothetical protein